MPTMGQLNSLYEEWRSPSYILPVIGFLKAVNKKKIWKKYYFYINLVSEKTGFSIRKALAEVFVRNWHKTNELCLAIKQILFE